MTTLLWQTALLLLGAYFLGAWVACIAQRMVHSARAGSGRLAAGGYPVEVDAGPAPPPQRLPDLEPISPRIQPVAGAARAAPPATAAPAAARDGQALPDARRAPPRPPRSEPPRPLDLPAAAGATGQGSTSAPAVRAAPAALPTEDLTRIRGIDAGLQERLRQLGATRFADIAGWTASDVARFDKLLGGGGRIARENWIEQAQVLATGGETAYSGRLRRGELPSAAPTTDEGEPRRFDLGPAAAPRPAAPPAPLANDPAAAEAAVAALPQKRVMGLGRDNLQRISQISAEVEKQLNFQGVSRYDHIAGWTASEVARFDKLLGGDGRIARENWIEQAQILARGGETAYSRAFDRRLAETSGETLRPARLAEAIRASARGEGEAARRPDAGNLRSVRAEAMRGDGAAAPRPGGADDLKRIRGIGVLIEKKLNAMGIATYEQIANWTMVDIERVSRVLDFKGRIERENWVEQARILASGGQTEFARRVERGEVETSRGKP